MAPEEPIRVQDALPRSKTKTGTRPSHWVNDEGTAFENPWASWRQHDWRDQLYIVFQHSKQCPVPPDNMSSLLPTRTPTWEFDGEDAATKIKATWMGHASFYVELPARASTDGVIKSTKRGPRVVFDPIFSERCSPIQWAGFKRITPPACSIQDLPEIDIVVISHDHYDHLDAPTIKHLSALPRIPHFFAPLGNEKLLKSLGVPAGHCHVLDWWETRRIEIEVPSPGAGLGGTACLDISCTPSQHNVGRNFMDRFYHPKSLWASWVVQDVGSFETKTVFFAGDTGYRAVLDGEDEDSVPVCEAFKEIGDRFKGIDLALIPIGAYLPRRYMSPIHCSPEDAVLLFQDLKAKNAIGMHWGTFVLTTEPVMDPPQQLKMACEKLGINNDTFICTEIGETRLY
ncbi:Metallo-hydrolase/oxidoreductase [Mycena vitilis]|nr:Metallo-hydrolase/oxidoreductase [Mycena vitilis]